MRIGILCQGFADWGGGIDFLRMVISSLQHSGEPVHIHALVPTRGPKIAALRTLKRAYRGAKALAGSPRRGHDRLDTAHLEDLASSAEQPVVIHEIDIGAPAILSAARRLSLDVLVPAIRPLPTFFPIPWVGYICDFQHRHLPQLFAPAEREQRDRQFNAVLANARSVVVNARAVAADISRFHPEARASVFALPFCAAPQAAWLVCGDSPAVRYGIERPYFIICNQFWKHKDHATAFAAFASLVANGPEVDLVCTGPTGDYRDPGYLPALKSGLARDGISGRVHILGMIPKADQIALLKGAIALVQPTLFEGGPGGGAVYDAVAIGQCCLVSDIAVNKELSEPGVTFFPAGDAAALAALMISSARQPCKVERDPKYLAERGRARRSACGVQLLAAIAHAQTRA